MPCISGTYDAVVGRIGDMKVKMLKIKALPAFLRSLSWQAVMQEACVAKAHPVIPAKAGIHLRKL